VIEREEFGPSLRRQRERRGLSLQEIAAKTKISAAQFAAMERNDFSRWPAGIFGRAFLRAYAEEVGLDGELVVRQFLQLFPSGDDGLAPPPPRAGQPGERDSRAQTTTAAPRPAGRTLARSFAGLAIGIVLVASAGVAGLMVGWAAAWPALAVAAVAAFAVASLLALRSLGVRLLKPRPAPPAAAPARPVANWRPIEPQQTRRRRRGAAGSVQATQSHRKDRWRPRI
jgi:transcriptional regulator with XRE-family HTH domain